VGGVDLHAVEAGGLQHGSGAAEAGDDVLDIGLGRRARLAEVAGYRQLYLRWCQRGQGHQSRALPAGVADLRPQLAAVGMDGARPGLERVDARVVFHHHVAGALQIAPVDHDVAAEQQGRAALGPRLVELLVGDGGATERVGQTFGHCGLAESVGECMATGQGEGLFDQGGDSAGGDGGALAPVRMSTALDQAPAPPCSVGACGLYLSGTVMPARHPAAPADQTAWAETGCRLVDR